jgi:hypothetical protein
LPLDFDGVVFRQLDAIMPQFEGYIGSPKVDFDDVVDAMVLWSRVPPVSIFEFKEGKREG